MLKKLFAQPFMAAELFVVCRHLNTNPLRLELKIILYYLLQVFLEQDLFYIVFLKNLLFNTTFKGASFKGKFDFGKEFHTLI